MNALVTICIGDNYNVIGDITHPSLKAYADKIGAEFIVLNKTEVSKTSPHFEKFKIFDLLNKYERIIYIDTDAIVRSDCPNLFDIVPKTRLGMMNEGRYQEREQTMRDGYAVYGGQLDSWDGSYYNSGVMVISRMHKELFRKPEKELWNFYEQTYLNIAIRKQRITMMDLDYKFNRLPCMDKKYGEHRIASYIIHYAGILGGLEGIIPADLKRWNKKEYLTTKRRIRVGVGARIGDNAEVEPVIRYMLELSDKNKYEFIVQTTTPELFEHLPVKVETFDAPPDIDNPCIIFNTTMDETDPRRPFFNGDRMHALDYASLMVVGGQIPVDKRQIGIKTTATGISELVDIVPMDQIKDGIVVHAGQSWASKTFPESWWETVIRGLRDQCKRKIVLVGQKGKETGVVNLSLPDGVIDLRNVLSLRGLIALLSYAPVLLSNDSSPIHIAGAFDNQIVAIPTCKHPDLIMPWRRGTQTYKSTTIVGKLTSDGMLIDWSDRSSQPLATTKGDLLDYLPSPEKVIDVVMERYREERPIACQN